MATPIQKIRELRVWLDEGLLSEAEFEQRKTAILDAVFAATSGTATDGKPARTQKEGLSTEQDYAGGTDLSYLAGQEVLGQSKAYRLERLLGQGGMGQVWKVIDLSTQIELGHSETLALKILAPELSGSAVHRRLLIEEAALVRKLAHDNIVRVYDWARDPATGNYFIIMEYLDGQDLEKYLRTHQRFSLSQVMRMLLPVAKALQYAWDKHQLVHRDLKPSNLFLCKNGCVKLLDFGISARLRSHTQANLSTASDARSAYAPNAGTLGYRAPEAGSHQHRYTPSLDVYAVAVMLYQLLEGALPFTAQRHSQQTPSQPSVLNALQWQVLQSGFAMDAEQRPRSVLALLEGLQIAGQAGDKQSMRDVAQIRGAAVNKKVLSEAEQKAEQRKQGKALEQQRRQQASAALKNLIAKQKQLQEMEANARLKKEAERLLQLSTPTAHALRFKGQADKGGQVLNADQALEHRISWEEAQRYLSKMSQPAGPRP
jgi:serine/threonine protein kinase